MANENLDQTELNVVLESKIFDLPPGVSSELERLHEIIDKNGGSVNKDMREWAMHKIDLIHRSYLNRSFYSVGDVSVSEIP